MSGPDHRKVVMLVMSEDENYVHQRLVTMVQILLIFM
jgi:hypothetical protein